MSNGIYELTFFSCGRNCLNNSNIQNSSSVWGRSTVITIIATQDGKSITGGLLIKFKPSPISLLPKNIAKHWWTRISETTVTKITLVDLPGSLSLAGQASSWDVILTSGNFWGGLVWDQPSINDCHGSTTSRQYPITPWFISYSDYGRLSSTGERLPDDGLHPDALPYPWGLYLLLHTLRSLKWLLCTRYLWELQGFRGRPWLVKRIFDLDERRMRSEPHRHFWDVLAPKKKPSPLHF